MEMEGWFPLKACLFIIFTKILPKRTIVTLGKSKLSLGPLLHGDTPLIGQVGFLWTSSHINDPLALTSMPKKDINISSGF